MDITICDFQIRWFKGLFFKRSERLNPNLRKIYWKSKELFHGNSSH